MSRIPLLRASALCLLVATLAACADATLDHAPAPAVAARAQALEGAAGPALAAIAERDWPALATLVGPHHSGPQPHLLTVESGPVDGYQGSPEPLIVRHPSSPKLSALIPVSAQLQVALLDLDGALHPLTYTLEDMPDSPELARLTLDPSALPAQGLLLIGPADADLELLGPEVIAFAVVDDVWACADLPTSCEAGEVACAIAAHAACFDADLSFIQGVVEGEDEVDALGRYLALYSAISGVTVSDAPVAQDAQGAWHKLTAQHPADAPLVRVVELDLEGGSRQLTWRDAGGHIELLAPAEGFAPGGLLVLDHSPGAPSVERMGAVRSPQTEAQVKACRTWTIQGCFQVRDGETDQAQNRPLAGIRVRGASTTRLGLGIYSTWTPGVTDQNGCFTTSNTFCGLASGADRRLRVSVSLDGPQLTVRNPLALETIFDQGFFRVIDDQAWRPHSSTFNAGTRVFEPGGAGELGVEVRRRQGVTWTTARRLDAALNAQDPWLRYQSYYAIQYPHPLWGGVALPIVPPIVQLTQSDWDIFTLVHEIGHVWHYMHNWGIMPNIVTSLINGWDTHNCAEDRNIAFLEGFAEYFAVEALCGGIFNLTCGDQPPRSRNGLLNHLTCNAEQSQGLVTPQMVIHNDDGVTHALRALTVNSFYQRDFQSQSQRFVLLNPLPALPTKTCQYYPFDNLNLFHVLRAFRANPALGYGTNFPSGISFGIPEFYERFGAIHNLPVGFLQDRQQIWDAAWQANPIDVCRPSCAETSPWWDGTQRSSVQIGAQCHLMNAPAGQTPFVSNNRYYLTEQRACPLGSFDGANCYVLHPAPGTQAVIVQDHLFTTALPGGVCPHGTYSSWLGACHIGQAAPGTSPFIYNGALYTTPLRGCPVGALESADRCYVGTPPRGATALVNQSAFVYPRQ